MEILSSLHITAIEWTIIIFCGILMGMSKVGVPGVSMIVVPTMAFIFGAKQSTGVLLPIMIMADIFGVSYYRRHADWSKVLKVLPWAVVGIFIALWVGEIINNKQFKNLIAILVFLSIGLMLWQDKRKNTHFFPDKWWFAAFMGILGGFATMIGNVAGPVFAIYLLAMHLPKNNFIGTGAWFFIIVNISKFPLQMFVWHNISPATLLVDAFALPGVALGAVLGFNLMKKIPEKIFRAFVMVITALSAFLLLL